MWAVTEKFRDYLAVTQFVAVTDCNPLAHQAMTRFGALEQRWSSRLANYQYTVEYRSGRSNANADGLSRLPLPAEWKETEDPTEAAELPPFAGLPRPSIPTSIGSTVMKTITTEEENKWAAWQRACPHIQRVKRCLSTKLSFSEREGAAAEL